MFPILKFCTTGWLSDCWINKLEKKWQTVAWLGMPTRLPVNSSCTTCLAHEFLLLYSPSSTSGCWFAKGDQLNNTMCTLCRTTCIYLFIFNLKSILNQKLVIKLDISVFSMLIQHRNPPRTWIVAFLDFTPLIPSPDAHCLWGHWLNLFWRELRRCVLSIKTRWHLFGCAAAAAAAVHQALLGATRRLPFPKEWHLKRFPV